MNANSISVHNLRKRFPGFLLDDISFQVPCGRIVGFIGENRAGKSTTIKLILDQLRRDGGSIEIFGEDNTKYLQHSFTVGGTGFAADVFVVEFDTGIADLHHFAYHAHHSYCIRLSP